MINVVLVEDSPVSRELLVHILTSDPEIRIVGITWNGEAAVDLVREKKPDVVLMDVKMPKMDGVEATSKILKTHKVPIVLTSAAYTVEDIRSTFRAIEAGAVAVLSKPNGVESAEYKANAEALIETIRSAANSTGLNSLSKKLTGAKTFKSPNEKDLLATGRVEIIAIGASTGGPGVLKTIFSLLPEVLRIPIVVVQHIAPGFIQGMVDWLQGNCRHRIEVATTPRIMEPGKIYFAPDRKHLCVLEGNLLSLLPSLQDDKLIPSVSQLFRSVARVYGMNAMGILLTGMGKDGAAELKTMRDKGAITITQNQETSAVYGMPGEAERLGAPMHILPPEEIVTLITNINKKEIDLVS